MSERRREQPQPSEAAKKFIASMIIDYEKWHDGLGYDLDALAKVPESERAEIERTLIERRPRDWRDIEALAHIDSPTARAEVEKALKSSDPHVRQTAMDYIPQHVDPKDREKLLIKSLETDVLFGGLSTAIDEAAEFHPPGVIEALLHGALDRDGEIACNFAALLFYLHGKAKEPFDWDHRPFFLRFNTSDRAERTVVFKEMCQIIGVDAKKYVR